MKNEKFGAKQIALTGVLLAICIVSQVFKNLSIFITGPVINACIILAALMINLPCSIILSIITPVTAFFIAGSPVMSAVPGIIPLIMLGNVVLSVSVHFLMKKKVISGGRAGGGIKNYGMGVVCSALKAAVMGLTISLWLLPTFIPAQSPLREKLPVFQMTFSLFQFITALIGFVYAFIIWAVVSEEQN